jgi:hypothetical protein
MKCQIALIALCLLCFSTTGFAQLEWETVYNPRTNRQEQRYNPYNEAQQAYERHQEAKRQRYDENMRAINQAWQQSERQRQELADRMAYMRMELQSRLNFGYAIIRAGKATTTYKAAPDFSLKKLLLEQATTPELKRVATEYTDASLQQFRDELRQHGIPPNDYAEAKALVFLLCYEVYFGEKPAPRHLAFARSVARQAYLKDAVFQSYNDLERQQKLEPDEALAIYARTLSRKGDAGSLAQAKVIAKGILEKLWVNSVETILMTPTGFMHKGRKIIDDGRATHLFQYNPDLPIAEINAPANSQYRNELINNNKRYLQLYYQLLSQKGGQKNDLAWCGTLVGYANYRVLAQQNWQEWNAAQWKSVYDFVKSAILASPDIQAASNESKQIACETMALLTAGNYARFSQGDLATAVAARSYLNNLFRALGLQPDHYQWTVNGIVKVK